MSLTLFAKELFTVAKFQNLGKIYYWVFTNKKGLGVIRKGCEVTVACVKFVTNFLLTFGLPARIIHQLVFQLGTSCSISRRPSGPQSRTSWFFSSRPNGLSVRD